MKPSRKTWSTPAIPEESRRIPCALCGSEKFRPLFSCEGFAYVRCASCGLAQINPQPLASEVRKRYRADHGDDYLAYEAANEEAFLRLQELTLGDLHFPALERTLFSRDTPPRILDIGCATGALLESLSRKGWQALGVEISTPQAEFARKERGLEIYGQSIEEVHFASSSFQVVHASHLIEHLNDPSSLIRETNRILEIGGIFLLTTPNVAGFQARVFRGAWRSAIFDHLYLFSLKTLSALLKKHGFALERSVTWGGLGVGIGPPFIKPWADRWAKRLGAGDVMALRARKIRDL